jgi:hypothetical protein
MRMHALFISRLRGVRRPLSRALLLVGLILFSFASAHATASEIVVKTDSIAPGVPLVVEGGYPAGRFGNVLTSPVDGTIVGVQIWWGSPQGNTPPSQQPAIRISTFSLNPGFSPTTIAQINSPTLVDGELNEYRFTDPGTNLIPLSVPITAGTQFFVDLEVANYTPEPEAENAPFILIDETRIPGGLFNFAAFEGSSRWIPFTLGISGGGEMGIRAIIQPVPEPSTYALAAIGVVALLAFRRRKAAA